MAAKSGPPDQIFRCGACDHVTLPGPHAWPTRYTALRGRIRMGLCALFLLIIAASVAEGRGSDDGCPTAPLRNAKYRMTHHISEGHYYMGIRTNDNNSKYLDIKLEAAAGAWVAVGFTKTPNMFDANVIGCVRYSGEAYPEAIDTWNPHIRNNLLNPNQTVICAHSANYTDGTVSCIFSRYIESGNNETDVDLDGDYYLLFGTGDSVQEHTDQGFTKHQTDPEVSKNKINPVTFNGEVKASNLREILVKFHGSLMIVAYPILAGIGLFFSAWMKPALPNGQWFQVHRAFMLASLVVAVVGFVLIFVAERDQEYHGYLGLVNLSDVKKCIHFAFGIALIGLQMANPIIALFRCNPDSELRWIFNIIHGKVIGYAVISLSMSNAGIGISLALSYKSDAFEIYLAYVVFVLLLYAALFGILFLISLLFSQEEDPDVLQILIHTKEGESDDEKGPINESKLKESSKDSLVRWGGLGLLLIVVLPLMIGVIVLLATGTLEPL